MTWSRIRAFLTRRRTRGQSLVEFTILLPVLLIMISGLIEFGFMLNYYLDLIDAARESARWAAGDDPIHDDNTGAIIDPNPNFYLRTQQVALDSIDVGSGGQISLDPATDDVVISAFAVTGGSVGTRYPSGSPLGLPLYNRHTSSFTSAEVTALLNPVAPNTGVVLVEIYYDYHMILGLPWIKLFVPDPVTLYAYSMMPNANVEATPTP
ncbi:MAG TPA: TadE/TadG family type IV pilus assembly protein [Anaerolineales bacterium]|nr:TadE/TadG family type IV pilus assembly protein [Anaerolineales bacterium]